MKPWHEQDAFWQTMADKMFTPSQWEQAAVEVDHLLALVKMAAGAAVLDLCCGPGRHSLELARRGFMVRVSTERKATSKRPRQGPARRSCNPWTFQLAT